MWWDITVPYFSFSSGWKRTWQTTKARDNSSSKVVVVVVAKCKVSAHSNILNIPNKINLIPQHNLKAIPSPTLLIQTQEIMHIVALPLKEAPNTKANNNSIKVVQDQELEAQVAILTWIEEEAKATHNSMVVAEVLEIAPWWEILNTLETIKINRTRECKMSPIIVNILSHNPLKAATINNPNIHNIAIDQVPHNNPNHQIIVRVSLPSNMEANKVVAEPIQANPMAACMVGTIKTLPNTQMREWVWEVHHSREPLKDLGRWWVDIRAKAMNLDIPLNSNNKGVAWATNHNHSSRDKVVAKEAIWST